MLNRCTLQLEMLGVPAPTLGSLTPLPDDYTATPHCRGAHGGQLAFNRLPAPRSCAWELVSPNCRCQGRGRHAPRFAQYLARLPYHLHCHSHCRFYALAGLHMRRGRPAATRPFPRGVNRPVLTGWQRPRHAPTGAAGCVRHPGSDRPTMTGNSQLTSKNPAYRAAGARSAR